jgi:tetratricopeptide (TPR) repeat protein
MGARRCRAALCLFLAVTVAGCASYVGNIERMDTALAAHDIGGALTALAPLEGGDSQALYLLDKAMLLRMRGDYAGSIGAFEAAKPLMRYLEATSVSETAAALTVSENLRSYAPPLYQRLLVHVYEALDYWQEEQPDKARVEIKQLNLLIKRLYPKSRAAPRGQDAFARYFAGLVYEGLGDWSDAMIAYRKAFKAYRLARRPVPPGLRTSLCRFADYLDLDKKLSRYKALFGIRSWPPVVPRDQADSGQLVFILGASLAPRKVAVTQWVPSPHSGRLVSISLPALRREPARISAAAVTAGDKTATTTVVENVGEVARETLAANMPELIASEAGRNIVRAGLANVADKKQHGLGALISFVGAAIDRADTRTWNTLPKTIQMARLRLPPGRYDVTVALQGRGGIMDTRVIENVDIEAGQITFAAWHAISYRE